MTKMKKCNICSKEIAKNAKSCPGCGAKNKKPFYKKIWFWVVIVIILMIMFGGNNDKPIVESENNSNSGTTNSTKNENTANDSSSSNNDVAQMELGKEYTVTSGSGGEYTIKIEGIRFTDERNQYSETEAQNVIFLDFSYSNISEAEETFVSDSNFKVMDDEGNVLKTYPVSDYNRMSQSLPQGGKCDATASFAMPVNSKNLKVIFYDNMFMNPTGELTIETGL